MKPMTMSEFVDRAVATAGRVPDTIRTNIAADDHERDGQAARILRVNGAATRVAHLEADLTAARAELERAIADLLRRGDRPPAWVHRWVAHDNLDHDEATP